MMTHEPNTTISHWGMFHVEPEIIPDLTSQFIEGWEVALKYPTLKFELEGVN